MGRKNEQGEPRKSRKVEGTTSGVFREPKALLRGPLRIVLGFTVALIVLNSSLNKASSDRPEVVPQTVIIDVAKPLAQPLQYRFAKEPKETLLEFRGNGKDWSFVQFDTLPPNTLLKTKDQPTGYSTSEEIHAGTWYWFRNKLPLVFVIKSGAQPPLNILFRFGSPPDNDKERVKGLQADEMRVYSDTHQFEKDPLTQNLTLTWDGGTGSSSIQLNPPTVTFDVAEGGYLLLQRTILTGDPKSWTFVRLKEVNRRIQLIARPTIPDNLTVETGSTIGIDQWIGFKDSIPIDVSLSANQPETGSEVIILETAIAQSPDGTKDSVAQDIKAKRIEPSGNVQLNVNWKPAQDNSTGIFMTALKWIVVTLLVIGLGVFLWLFVSGWWQGRKTMGRSGSSPHKLKQSAHVDKLHASQGHMPAQNKVTGVVNRAPDAAQVTPAGEIGTASTGIRTVVPVGVNTKPISDPSAVRQEAFIQLQNQLRELWDELDKKADRPTAIPATQDDLNQKLAELRQQMQQEATAETNKQIRAMGEVKGEFTSRLDKIQSEMREQKETLKLSDDDIKESVNTTRQLISNSEDRLKSRLDQLEQMLVQQAFPESFFARTLGMILSKNMDDRGEGNLERLIGECLNHFFQAEVPRADSLHELSTRAKGVVDALRRVVDLMTTTEPASENKSRPHLRRAEELLAEVGELHTQLQTRKLSIDTTLRFPVSAYPGARQSFLDELGRGIRSAIDKFADPKNYFEGDLERIVTADLIAIVDICDNDVSPPPGSHAELEAALKQLFEQAGLREIIPRVGQPFGTGEQDLVEMVPGAPGTNMTVAAVITRGFYFTHRDNETLLRKAGVKVYR
jgi:hypothetical protein